MIYIVTARGGLVASRWLDEAISRAKVYAREEHREYVVYEVREVWKTAVELPNPPLPPPKRMA